jgi:RNA polymerase sigma factor (sigma-70 family)
MTFFAGDRDLLERFRQGDRAVLDRVYQHYVRPLSHILRQGFSVPMADRIVHVPGLSKTDMIESACQEVFLRAFRPAARLGYDGERSYGNYLFRIARNWRIDEHRRRELPLADVLLEDLPLADATPDAEVRLVDAELAGLVETYLSSVPSRDSAYFRHRFVDGLPQTDAAARLGMTRIQGRRIEARVKSGLLDFLRARGHGGSR